MEYCCERMDFFLKEEKVDIYYEEEFRQYAIGMKNGTSAVQTIHYCPWCGAKFPKNLRKDWFNILEHEYGLESPWEEKERIPVAFRTDEWWKKRGL